jgi:hypothetical protein
MRKFSFMSDRTLDLLGEGRSLIWPMKIAWEMFGELPLLIHWLSITPETANISWCLLNVTIACFQKFVGGRDQISLMSRTSYLWLVFEELFLTVFGVERLGR